MIRLNKHTITNPKNNTLMEERIAKTIPEWKDLLAEEAEKTHANATITFELEGGARFILRYTLPKKGGKQ